MFPDYIVFGCDANMTGNTDQTGTLILNEFTQSWDGYTVSMLKCIKKIKKSFECKYVSKSLSVEARSNDLLLHLLTTGINSFNNDKINRIFDKNYLHDQAIDRQVMRLVLPEQVLHMDMTQNTLKSHYATEVNNCCSFLNVGGEESEDEVIDLNCV